MRGCLPKKVLVGAAEAMDWNMRMKGKGVVPGNAHIEWSELMEFKRSFTDTKPKRIEKGLSGAGISTFYGAAVFTGKDTMKVGDETLKGKKILIATGAKPMKLGIPGEGHVTISDEFLEMEKLPKRIVFVGGGVISFEFAHIAARTGATVQIIHRSEKVLKKFDQDMVEKILEESREIGIEVYINHPVKSVEKKGDKLFVHTAGEGGKSFETDMVVHGSGRVPDIEELNPEAAGIEFGRKGVKVNEYLQSVSNPLVYAAGDSAATRGPKLSPVAGLEGRIAARNMIEGNVEKPDYSVVPTVVFTLPPVASVGLDETSATEMGIEFNRKFQDTSGWYSSQRIGHKHTAHKVLIETGSNKIIGAHLVGPNAEEIINFYALAIKHGITADDIKAVPWAFPSVSNDVKDML